MRHASFEFVCPAANQMPERATRLEPACATRWRSVATLSPGGPPRGATLPCLDHSNMTPEITTQLFSVCKWCDASMAAQGWLAKFPPPPPSFERSEVFAKDGKCEHFRKGTSLLPAERRLSLAPCRPTVSLLDSSSRPTLSPHLVAPLGRPAVGRTKIFCTDDESERSPTGGMPLHRQVSGLT